MAKEFWVETQVNTEVLAEQLSSELKSEDVLDFILQVDANMANTTFTRELIERLENILIEEEGSL